MLSSVEKALEYDKIKALLKKYTASQLGNARVDNLTPSADVDQVRYLQTLCSEAKFFFQLYGGIPLDGLMDIRALLSHADKTGSILGAEELLDVRKVAQIPGKIHRVFEKRDREEFPHLFNIADTLPVFPELVEAINYCINPEGVILDRASPELRVIRRKLSRLRENIQRKLETILRAPEHQKAIQEPVITSRNNRYVIPIKQEARASFKGIVQGQSTSGATFFVEPLSIVQMNNDLHDAAETEQREIRRILLELTDCVRESLYELGVTLDILADLDFLNAKVRFSLNLNAIEPKLNTRGIVKLIQARHPLLEYHLQNAHKTDTDTEQNQMLPERIVPTNVHIGETFKTLIITGPNTGGKTVVLKTVGLSVLMAQSGLHIPAEHGSEVAIFDHVFADIGDDQGIEQSLSTFSSHITKIAGMLETVENADYSLVLLDEIGAGTDPTEGTALGMAILDWLGERNVNTIVTTHYGALKAYAHTQQAMENASMEFDATTLRPTYRLQIGIPGSSNAIHIASQLGIPTEILDEAQNFMGKNIVAVEDLLVELQERKNKIAENERQLQNKLRDADARYVKYDGLLQTLETEKETLKKQAEDEARQIVADARRTVENVIADIRRERASKESVKKALSKTESVKKQPKPKQPVKQPKQPKVEVNTGDKVRVKQWNKFAEVIAVKSRGKKPIQVLMGNMRMHVDYHEIDSVHSKQKSAHLSTSVLDIQYHKANTVSGELDLHGMRAAEAADEVRKYLDNAVLAGLPSVRILHGRGSGVLCQIVREALQEYPYIANYQYASFDEGGEGVTVATFKE